MLATPASTLPAGDEWSYEVKWDGYRAQAVKNGTAVSLASRNLKNITAQFPGVTRAIGRVRAQTAHIDGEIVALDAQGRPSFQGLELVIGGFKPSGRTFDSLIVGYYDGAKLMSAGKVRNGLTPHLRVDLFDRLQPLIVGRCPFANLPSTATSHWGEGITPAEMNALAWVKPRLVAQVSFVEWTRDGSLRHASFIALREDKRAREVRQEPQSSVTSRQSSVGGRQSASLSPRSTDDRD